MWKRLSPGFRRKSGQLQDFPEKPKSCILANKRLNVHSRIFLRKLSDVVNFDKRLKVQDFPRRVPKSRILAKKKQSPEFWRKTDQVQDIGEKTPKLVQDFARNILSPEFSGRNT